MFKAKTMLIVITCFLVVFSLGCISEQKKEVEVTPIATPAITEKPTIVVGVYLAGYQNVKFEAQPRANCINILEALYQMGDEVGVDCDWSTKNETEILTINITDLRYMFYGGSRIKEINVSDLLREKSIGYAWYDHSMISIIKAKYNLVGWLYKVYPKYDNEKQWITMFDGKDGYLDVLISYNSLDDKSVLNFQRITNNGGNNKVSITYEYDDNLNKVLMNLEEVK